jgi:hypothetical protein
LLILISLGVLALITCGLWILHKWQRGVIAFVLYTPVSGAVQLLLFPAPWPILIKDILFAFPLYIAFFVSGGANVAWRETPKAVKIAVTLFIGVVVVQMLNPFNPDLTGILAPLIGAKVWLFYVPMISVGIGYADTTHSLINLSRLMLCLTWLPCLVGILEYAMSQRLGYDRTMHMFYGDAALAATQQLTSFSVGLMRIPSTFSSVTQYLNFILCMLVPALGLRALERDPFWKRMCTATVGLLCVAGVLCGARAAFVTIPLLLGAFYFMKGGYTTLVLPGLVLVAGLYFVLSTAGIDISGLTTLETELVNHYSLESQASFVEATIAASVFGEGVGSNTNEAQPFVKEGMIKGVENYYAKIVIELGIIGLVIVTTTHLILIYLGLQNHYRLTGSDLRDYADAITALLILTFIYDAKGQAIDFDPLNMFYWLFAGVLIHLPNLNHKKNEKVSWQYDYEGENAFSHQA